MDDPKISAVVLAAGRSSRFGSPKVLARIGGIALVRHVVDRLVASGVDEIVVVAGGESAATIEALVGSPARTVVNPDPDAGMSASLNVGVLALSSECRGFYVALGDQPLIDADVLGRLQSTWEESNAAAVVPQYRGKVRGNPVFFDATMRRQLQQLTGDRGARDLLTGLGDRVIVIDVDAEAPIDVDTEADLRALLRTEG